MLALQYILARIHIHKQRFVCLCVLIGRCAILLLPRAASDRHSATLLPASPPSLTVVTSSHPGQLMPR